MTEDIDEIYRRASALDPGRPGEAVRRKVLEHAAAVAAAPPRPAAYRARWRPAIFGTLAAAGLAGLLIIPRVFTPQVFNPPVINPGTSRESAHRTAASVPPPAATPPPAASLPRAAAPPPIAAQPSVAASPPIGASPPDAAVSPLAGAAPNADAAPSGEPPSLNAAPASPPSPPQLANYASSKRASVPQAQVASGMGTPGSLAAVHAPSPRAAEAAPSAGPAAALRRAAAAGDVPELRSLLQAEVLIDAPDPLGRTALMLAASQGRIEAVDVLLAHGADPNLADAEGTTPLQAALAIHQPVIAAALRRAGAR